MACFISSSSSEESLCGSTRESTVFSDDEVQKKKVQGRAKRTKKIPAKLRDYVPSISKEEERLQKSMLNIMHGTLYNRLHRSLIYT